MALVQKWGIVIIFGDAQLQFVQKCIYGTY